MNSSSLGLLCLAQINNFPYPFLQLFKHLSDLTCIFVSLAQADFLWEEHISHLDARESPEKALRNLQFPWDLDCIMQMCWEPEYKHPKLTAQLTLGRAAFRSWERLNVGQSRAS